MVTNQCTFCGMMFESTTNTEVCDKCAKMIMNGEKMDRMSYEEMKKMRCDVHIDKDEDKCVEENGMKKDPY